MDMLCYCFFNANCYDDARSKINSDRKMDSFLVVPLESLTLIKNITLISHYFIEKIQKKNVYQIGKVMKKNQKYGKILN